MPKRKARRPHPPKPPPPPEGAILLGLDVSSRADWDKTKPNGFWAAIDKPNEEPTA